MPSFPLKENMDAQIATIWRSMNVWPAVPCRRSFGRREAICKAPQAGGARPRCHQCSIVFRITFNCSNATPINRRMKIRSSNGTSPSIDASRVCAKSKSVSVSSRRLGTSTSTASVVSSQPAIIRSLCRSLVRSRFSGALRYGAEPGRQATNAAWRKLDMKHCRFPSEQSARRRTQAPA